MHECYYGIIRNDFIGDYMQKMFNFFSMITGSITGVLLYLFGDFDQMLKVLVVLIVLDWITGLLTALYNKKINSDVGFKGIIKKVFILITVIVSSIMQFIIKLPIRDIVIMFFITNESISILENISVVIPVPIQLKNILGQLRDDNIHNVTREDKIKDEKNSN